MKQLNYFHESDDHGYLFDPTVFEQEDYTPIWDEHSYECIASELVASMCLEDLAYQLWQTGRDNPNDVDQEAVDQRYQELEENLEETLNELWDLIKDNPYQCVFVHKDDFFAMFDNTYKQEMNEFSITYGNREWLCGSSATFIWKECVSAFM